MHEMSLMSDMLKQISQVIKDENASKVIKVTVQLGALSQISAEHFREHFDHAVKEAFAYYPELELELADDITDKYAQDILLKSVEVE